MGYHNSQFLVIDPCSATVSSSFSSFLSTLPSISLPLPSTLAIYTNIFPPIPLNLLSFIGTQSNKNLPKTITSGSPISSFFFSTLLTSHPIAVLYHYLQPTNPHTSLHPPCFANISSQVSTEVHT